MIPVIETEGELLVATGNPTLISKDRTRKAPLVTILHHSWSDADRAAFGVYLAVPFAEPDGTRSVGEGRFERGGDGIIRQVFDVEVIPEMPPRRGIAALQQEVDELRERVAALEGKRK